MAIVGDTIERGERTLRFETDTASLQEAYRYWSPFSQNEYSNTTLALAKLDVPIDDSRDEKVIILVDTGSNQAFIYLQKGSGYGASFDLSFDLILQPGLGRVQLTQTKSEAGAKTWALGEQGLITDIDTGVAFLLTYDGTDLTSAKFWMQLGSSTIQASPTLNVNYPFMGFFWECIDATAGEEVFKMSDKKVIQSHTGNATLTVDECKGTVHNNVGTAGAVELTLPPAILGLHLTLTKTVDQTLTLTADGAETINTLVSVVHDLSQVNASLEISCQEVGKWTVVNATGEWHRLLYPQAVYDHTVTGNILVQEMQDGVITNSGAGETAIVLTMPVPVRGMRCTLIKDDNGTITVNDDQAVLIVEHLGSQNDKAVVILYTDHWVPGYDSGTWTT